MQLLQLAQPINPGEHTVTTIQDVARAAGVAASTVSRYLNGKLKVSPATEAKVLEAYAAAGFQRAVHWLPSAPRGPVERALDRYEAAIAEFHGE